MVHHWKNSSILHKVSISLKWKLLSRKVQNRWCTGTLCTITTPPLICKYDFLHKHMQWPICNIIKKKALISQLWKLLCRKNLQCTFPIHISTHFSTDVRLFSMNKISSLFEVAWKGGTKQRLHSSVCQLAYEIIPLAKVFDKCCMWTKS